MSTTRSPWCSSKDNATQPLPPTPSPRRRGGADPVFLPLSASGRGTGGGVLPDSPKSSAARAAGVVSTAIKRNGRRMRFIVGLCGGGGVRNLRAPPFFPGQEKEKETLNHRRGVPGRAS